MDGLNHNKVATAIKWSGITEIMAKLVSPITSMVLARLLTPEAFGVVATITMIVSFAEIFTDAGFQKYLVQHNFKDDEDREQSTTVAFWSNLLMSLLLWGIIGMFSAPLASVVGNPGLGTEITIACISIPLAAFSSIQMALYKRDFAFKVLFKVRIVGICVPIFVTIPLALYFQSYWALIIGTIVKDISVVIALSYYSTWKPRFYYSINKLKEMLSFTVWTIMESISIWFGAYIDIFIVGRLLSQYYLGLYKTSMTTVTQITGVVTAAFMPIIFASLSRLQNSKSEFRNTFLKFQHISALIMLPLGICMYLYSDIVTLILLGKQWGEASNFIGLYGVTLAFQFIFSVLCSEAYRAVGKPKVSLLVQLIYLVFFIPIMWWSAGEDYTTLYQSRAVANLLLIVLNLIVFRIVIQIKVSHMLKNLRPLLFACFAMLICGYFSNLLFEGVLGTVCSGMLSVVIYLVCLLLFPQERVMIRSIAINLKR